MSFWELFVDYPCFFTMTCCIEGAHDSGIIKKILIVYIQFPFISFATGFFFGCSYASSLNVATALFPSPGGIGFGPWFSAFNHSSNGFRGPCSVPVPRRTFNCNVGLAILQCCWTLCKWTYKPNSWRIHEDTVIIVYHGWGNVTCSTNQPTSSTLNSCHQGKFPMLKETNKW